MVDEECGLRISCLSRILSLETWTATFKFFPVVPCAAEEVSVVHHRMQYDEGMTIKSHMRLLFVLGVQHYPVLDEKP
jgi:hypothetical protein